MDSIQPWIIYLWRNGDKYEGASPVVTKDGIKDIYGFGWMIEKVPDARLNEDRHQAWRARINVKKMLNNTLNVINWYGKKVLDAQGNVDPIKLAGIETENAFKASSQNVDINDLYKIKKFPTKDITMEEAESYGFRGDRVQNKFVGKI